ncbi:MAG: 2-phosphosulfolactate phosphatase [Ignavibacteria bacterium]|nr:MAG: 2-phosphosulfolactate phosphatase [Ignavibacteria bacterium]
MPGKSPIRIETRFTPREVDELHFKDKNVVVIDVLRASTTIAVALRNGAKEIIPVANVESAVKISGSLFGDVTLRAGERNARRIEGFNLGNSPREFTEAVVRGKSIIFMTTNGTSAMARGRHARKQIIAGFINLSMVVNFLRDLMSDFIILCAGRENGFCIEDAVCAGKIINRLAGDSEPELILDDSGRAAAALDMNFGADILKMLERSTHGAYLSEIGFAEDLKVCGELDSVSVLPVLSGSVIRVNKQDNTRTA